MERRQNFRYGVWASAEFVWADGNGIQHWGEGITRDISSKGIFVCCNHSDLLPPGKADVEITVRFPAFGEQGKVVELEADAVVIRVEPSIVPMPARGFAVLNRSFRLKEPDAVPNA